jgi:hypothetical protein
VGQARSGIGTCLTEEELLEHLVEDFWVLMLEVGLLIAMASIVVLMPTAVLMDKVGMQLG